MAEAFSRRTEVSVGIFVIAVMFCVIAVAGCFVQGRALDGGYRLYADFASVSGLHVGNQVAISGVKVGEVEAIELADYQGRVTFWIKDGVKIDQDAIVSIRTESLIGDRSVTIQPGTSDTWLSPGDEIKNTRSVQTFQELVGRRVAGDLVPGSSGDGS